MWNDAEMKIKIIMLVFGCDKMEVPGGIKRNREGGEPSHVPIYVQREFQNGMKRERHIKKHLKA